MKISNILVGFDKFFSYIPFFSSLVALVNVVVQRHFAKKSEESREASLKNRYIEYVTGKEESTLVTIALPLINLKIHTHKYKDPAYVLDRLKHEKKEDLTGITAKVISGFSKNETILLAAIEKLGPQYFEAADASLKEDRSFVEKAVQINGLVLQFVDKTFREDKEIVQAAVEQDGYALQFASEDLQKNAPDIIASALRNRGDLIQGLLNNLDLAQKTAVVKSLRHGKEPQPWKGLSLDETVEAALILAAIKTYRDAIRILPNRKDSAGISLWDKITGGARKRFLKHASILDPKRPKEGLSLHVYKSLT